MRAERPVSLSVHCTDVRCGLAARLGPDGVTTAAAGEPAENAAGADCTVAGEATDLYLALWNRAGTEHVAVDGDEAVLNLFFDAVHVR